MNSSGELSEMDVLVKNVQRHLSMAEQCTTDGPSRGLIHALLSVSYAVLIITKLLDDSDV